MADAYDWRNDPVYAEWEAALYKERMSFDAAVKRCGIDEWDWKDQGWREVARKNWEKFALCWNEEHDATVVEDEVTTLGFAAITLCYVSVPFEMLRGDDATCKDVTCFVAKMSNRAHVFELGNVLTCFELAEDLTKGPLHPGAYMEWIADLYNKASWWFCFLVFEREKRQDQASILTRFDENLSLPAKWK